MRAKVLVAVLTIACLPGIAPAHADEAPNLFYGYVQLMNNYIGRGLSQSVGKPSLQAEIDVNPGSGLYGNLSAVHIGWIDKVYPGDSVHIEVDGVIGWREKFGRSGEMKFGVLQMQFPGRYKLQSPPVQRPDTTEVFGYIGWNGVSARLNYDVTDSFATPDSRGSWYLDTNANWPFADSWNLGAHLGRRQSRGRNPLTGADNAKQFSYTDYKLSIARGFGLGTSLTLAYSWTTADPAIYTLNGYNVGGRHVSVVLEKDF
ncbi:TorF family putative porin [Dokdonella soli]|uniref:TorF family putative porin n=1 Tax=Dokdonella soli TaxID=529810 RepID=A0ABN1ID41_9GAMM